MKNKTLKKGLLSFLCFLLGCVAFYLFLAFYYQDSFSYGTWINGIYCTGKSVQQVNYELIENKTDWRFQILLRDQKKVELNPADFSYLEDYEDSLKAEKALQNPFLWGLNLFETHKKILLPSIRCDVEQLSEAILELEFMKENTILSSPKVEIMETGNGYELFDNTGQILNAEYAKAKIISSILAGERLIDLDDGICYEEIAITDQMQETYELWEKVDEFQDFTCNYLFGDRVEVLDSIIIADWIAKTEQGDFLLDSNGNLILKEEMVAEYIASLASKYDTLGGKRTVQATRGDMVTIEGGTYGNQLDQKTETQYLLNAFLQNNQADRTPVYLKSAKKQGQDDIGDTYIEIDMTQQMLYYYEENELILSTSVVTGNMRLKRATPERVCYVYAKQKNRVLRGPGYAAHVNFWMPVNGNIGIHDAKWRKEFGGEIYQTDGSHGCINTPYDSMKILYEEVEIGTPVIMFY